MMRKSVMGVPIMSASMEEVLDLVDSSIREEKKLHIGVVNAAKIVTMQTDTGLRESVLASDVIFADGMAIVWASRILGSPLAGRIAGIDLMFGIFSRGDQKNYRIYCLGATEEVVSKVQEDVLRLYPGVLLVGARNGYFSEDEEEKVAQAIRDARPDILFVAITSPRKEVFLERWQSLMDVPVCHGVGGSFDVMAGKVRRAPEIWQKMGMEWLYRVLQEPRRLWRRYLITNSKFIFLVLKYRIRKWAN